MKNIFKKNQIIITALAVMIAVAGYLNYSGSKLGEGVSPTAADESSVKKETEDMASTETANDSALIDIESLDEDFTDENYALENTGSEDASADSDDVSADLSADASGESQVTDTPGEAVLTSVPGSSGFAAEARLSREQVRAKNKETLLEVINNTNIAEEQKQDAINSMNEMADIAEKEAAAELLLESKGFTDAVVSITDGTVDVVISQVDVTDAQRAQIEDIVKRKTEISGENIVITPMASQAETTAETDAETEAAQ